MIEVIDGAHVVTVMHPDTKARRDELTAVGLCINGIKHGPATDGRLCSWCRAVHNRGVLVVLGDPTAPPRPPGYKFYARDDMRIHPRRRMDGR